MIIGFIVSMMTNELSVSVISLFVMMRVLPAEFVMLIENVALPLVSLGKTRIVNVAFPPLVVFVNDLPRNVPLKLPRSSGNNFANASKTITVTLDAESNDLGNFTGIILGKNITDTNPSIVTINNATPGTATFTTTVLPTDTNGNITFSITATNSTGSTLIITNSNITDNSFVTIDTVKPVITLNGAPLVRIIQEATYSDQGAAVDDPDNPSYTGNVVTTFATPLNTSVLGNTIITYTAPADAAGNVPDSKTRTVRVVMNDTIVDGNHLVHQDLQSH